SGLQMHKVATDNEFTSGEDQTYLITVCNTGNDTLSNVVVADTLDARLDFVMADPQPTTGLSDTISWTLPTLPPGDCLMIQLSVMVAADAVDSTLTNWAYVGVITDTGDTLSQGDSTQVLIREPREDIDIEIAATETHFVSGETGTFLITVTNPGEDSLFNVVIVDTLPGRVVDFDDGYPQPDSIISVGGDTLVYWSIDVLPPGEIEYYQLSVVVYDSVSAPDSVLNIVYIEAYDEQGELVTSVDSTVVQVLEPVEGLDIEVVAGESYFESGDIGTFIITVMNSGMDSLFNLVIVDTLDGSLADYADGYPPIDSIGTSASGDTLIYWSISSLPPGEFEQFQLSVAVYDSVQASSLTNIVYVEG
ncbi:MAG: DUF11 domain-containing protein, partial [Chloroflexi bacterium]|nr:DUF11 domain-containing protein [Chloroflexota bacterium]